VQTRIPTNPIPGLPQMEIGTLDEQPMFGDKVVFDPTVRMNCLYVRNTNPVDILYFCSRFQLPEPVVMTNQQKDKSVGVEIDAWRPLRAARNVAVSGQGASVSRQGSAYQYTVSSPGSSAAAAGLAVLDGCFDPGEQRPLMASVGRPGDLTGIWELSIAKLPPSGFVRIYFSTSNGPEATNYITVTTGGWMPGLKQTPEVAAMTRPRPDGLFFYWEGEFQFNADGRLGKQRFFVPLFFNAQRRLTQSRVQADKGPWDPVTVNFGF